MVEPITSDKYFYVKFICKGEVRSSTLLTWAAESNGKSSDSGSDSLSLQRQPPALTPTPTLDSDSDYIYYIKQGVSPNEGRN